METGADAPTPPQSMAIVSKGAMACKLRWKPPANNNGAPISGSVPPPFVCVPSIVRERSCARAVKDEACLRARGFWCGFSSWVRASSVGVPLVSECVRSAEHSTAQTCDTLVLATSLSFTHSLAVRAGTVWSWRRSGGTGRRGRS
eukprot:2807283-Rhodomonas_salina.1